MWRGVSGQDYLGLSGSCQCVLLIVGFIVDRGCRVYFLNIIVFILNHCVYSTLDLKSETVNVIRTK